MPATTKYEHQINETGTGTANGEKIQGKITGFFLNGDAEFTTEKKILRIKNQTLCN